MRQSAEGWAGGWRSRAAIRAQPSLNSSAFSERKRFPMDAYRGGIRPAREGGYIVPDKKLTPSLHNSRVSPEKLRVDIDSRGNIIHLYRSEGVLLGHFENLNVIEALNILLSIGLLRQKVLYYAILYNVENLRV